MPQQRKFKGLARDFINAIKTQFIGQGAKPEDIFIQDLYNYEGSVSTNVSLKNNDIATFNKLTTEDRKILDVVLKVYNENIKTKRELLEQSRQLFEKVQN